QDDGHRLRGHHSPTCSAVNRPEVSDRLRFLATWRTAPASRMSAMVTGRQGARIRLADVAEHAGVSMKTVSNVVHDYPHVSADLRARVQASIDELGYRPNLTARRLVTGRTGMIALAIPEIDQPYFAELARHISAEAGIQGY